MTQLPPQLRKGFPEWENPHLSFHKENSIRREFLLLVIRVTKIKGGKGPWVCLQVVTGCRAGGACGGVSPGPWPPSAPAPARFRAPLRAGTLTPKHSFLLAGAHGTRSSRGSRDGCPWPCGTAPRPPRRTGETGTARPGQGQLKFAVSFEINFCTWSGGRTGRKRHPRLVKGRRRRT